MTMEPIQNTAVSYQGSGATVEKKQTALKEPEYLSAATEQGKQDLLNGENIRQTDKVVVPEKASESSLKKAVEEINRKSANTEAVFGYHEGTNRVTIKIIDKDTKQVKKEYPAEETLDMIQKVWEMAGLMVDEKR